MWSAWFHCWFKLKVQVENLIEMEEEEFIEAVSSQLDIPLSFDRSLREFMTSDEVGFKFSPDHKITSFPWWWQQKSNSISTKRKNSSKTIYKKKTKSASEANLLEVPLDVLQIILSSLSLEEKRCCRLICKHLRKLVETRLLQIAPVITSENKFNLEVEWKRFPNAEKLIVKKVSKRDMELLDNVPLTITHLNLDFTDKPRRCWPNHITKLDLSVNWMSSYALLLPSDSFRDLNLTSLSIWTNRMNLSQAIHLTCLKIGSSKQEDCDPILVTLRHPEKILELTLESEPASSSLPHTTSNALDPFVNIQKLILCNYDTLSSFHHLRSLTVISPKQFDQVTIPMGSSLIDHLAIEGSHLSRSQMFAVLMHLPKSISRLCIRCDEKAASKKGAEYPVFQLNFLETSNMSLLPFKMSDVIQLEINEISHRKFEEMPRTVRILKLTCDVFAENIAPPSHVSRLHITTWIRSRSDWMDNLEIVLETKKWPNRKELKMAGKLRKIRYADPMMRHVVEKMTEMHQRWKTEWKDLMRKVPWMESHGMMEHWTGISEKTTSTRQKKTISMWFVNDVEKMWQCSTIIQVEGWKS